MADSEEQQQVQPQQQEEEEEAAQQQQDEQTPSAADQPTNEGDEHQQQQEDVAEQQEEKEEAGGGGGEEVGEGGGGAAEAAAGEAEEGEGGAVEEELTEEKVSLIDSPHWLSQEDCLARGVPEDQVSAFQHTYIQLAYTIKTWYNSQTEQTFTTDFISLSNEEVDLLLAAFHPGQSAQPELTDEQKASLQQLEEKLDDVIKKYGDDGCFIRVNDRNLTDAILERNDAEFVARVRDAVINDIEASKQAANAYLIWGEQEKSEGAFRRGMTRLRQSFRRQRAPSTSTSAAAKKDKTSEIKDTSNEQREEEAEKKEEEAEVEETGAAATGETKETEEGDKDGGEEGGEGEATVTVDVEAQVEGGEEKKEEEEGELTGEVEPQAAASEPAQEPSGEDTAAEQEKKESEDEIVPAAPEEQEQKAEEEEQEPKREELPPIRKTKPEPLDNEILRAFGRIVTGMYKVVSGKEAMEMLLRSGVVKQHLQQLKDFGDVDGISATISITRYHSDIAHYPGMVLRGFVYKGELTALSQKHDDVTFFPNLAQYKDIIQHKVKQYYDEKMKESLASSMDSYIVDLFVSIDTIYIIRVSPFYYGTGTCLYTWAEHGDQLTNPPLDFKIIESPIRSAPELYSGLQNQWSSMLDSVLTQKQNESRSSQSGRSCTIL